MTKSGKHAVLIGREDELHELYDELTKARRGYMVDALFTDVGIPDFLPDKTTRYDHATVMSFLEVNGAVSHVFCSASVLEREEMAELYYFCEKRGVTFIQIPLYVSSLRRCMNVGRMGHLTLLKPRRAPLSLWYNRALKRAFDLLFSLLALLTFFPLVWVVQAIRVKHRRGGAVFLRQKRCGPDGHVFHCLSFNQTDERTRLSRMPRLINILLGEMSFVGPALRSADDIEDYFREADRYHIRRWPRAGLTGWASVNSHAGQSRPKTALANEVDDDVWYVENWSFWLDLRILLASL